MTVRITWDVAPAERPLADGDAVAAAAAALGLGGRPGLDVDVIFVDDATLAGLHARFLGDSAPTDVLAFDLSAAGESQDAPEPTERGPAGEIYVSVDCAQRVAPERGVAVARELALYVVHGALHLCGFDDREEADRSAMREAESRVLDTLGYGPDSAPHDA